MQFLSAIVLLRLGRGALLENAASESEINLKAAKFKVKSSFPNSGDTRLPPESLAPRQLQASTTGFDKLYTVQHVLWL